MTDIGKSRCISRLNRATDLTRLRQAKESLGDEYAADDEIKTAILRKEKELRK